MPLNKPSLRRPATSSSPPNATSSPPSTTESFEEKRYSLWLLNTTNNINNNNNSNSNSNNEKVVFEAKDEAVEEKNKRVKKTVKRVIKRVVKKVVKKKVMKDENVGELEFERNNIVSCSDESMNPKTDVVTDVDSDTKDKIRVVKKESNNGKFGLLEFERNKNNNIVSCSEELVNLETDVVTDVDSNRKDKIRIVVKKGGMEEVYRCFGLSGCESGTDIVSCSDGLLNPKADIVTDVDSNMLKDRIMVLKKVGNEENNGDFWKLETRTEAVAFEEEDDKVLCSNEVRSPNCDIVNDKTRGMKRAKREEKDGELGSGPVSTTTVEFENSGSHFDNNNWGYDMMNPKRLQKEECGEKLGKMEVDDEAKNDNSNISVFRATETVQILSSDNAASSASMSIESDNNASGQVVMEHVKIDNSTINKDENKVRVVEKNVVTKVPKNVQKEKIPNTVEFRNKNFDIAKFHVPYLSADKNNGVSVDNMETENENYFDDASDNVVDNVNITANKEENYAMVEKLRSEASNQMEEDFMMPDEMVSSAEMEASERRKRRKTQIFVGGLDKDAVEEDVRKVFQKIGEILEVTVKMNERTGKNKGFAFLRYASAVDAKKAVEKSGKIEILGKTCSVEFMKGNDTIYLGNIDKTWKIEDIFKLLQDAGVDKIDKITIKPDPGKPECNVGYAFLELETIRDAQITFGLLEKKSFLGNKKIRVEWAKQLSEADEEELYKAKTVYAEYLPVSWDEEAVKDHFKKFGEVENVVLARNLVTSKRKDFAFVSYKTREAALACIRGFTHNLSQNENSKIKVHFAKSTPKSKQAKHACSPVLNTRSLEKPKTSQIVVDSIPYRSKALSTNHIHDNNRFVVQPHIGNKGESTSNLCENSQSTTSTNDELVQLLREQASWRQPQTSLAVGCTGLDFTNSLPTRKRQYSLMDPNDSDLRRYPRPRTDIALLNPSVIYRDVEIQSLPHNYRQGLSYSSGLPCDVGSYFSSSQSQTRGASPGGGASGVYRRY